MNNEIADLIAGNEAITALEQEIVDRSNRCRSLLQNQSENSGVPFLNWCIRLLRQVILWLETLNQRFAE